MHEGPDNDKRISPCSWLSQKGFFQRETIASLPFLPFPVGSGPRSIVTASFMPISRKHITDWIGLPAQRRVDVFRCNDLLPYQDYRNDASPHLRARYAGVGTSPVPENEAKASTVEHLEIHWLRHRVQRCEAIVIKRSNSTSYSRLHRLQWLTCLLCDYHYV